MGMVYGGKWVRAGRFRNYGLLLAVCIDVAAGQFFGEFLPKLMNYDTGMLYMGDKDTFGINKFGPVCIGTGERKLSGNNGELFGNITCKKMGFDSAAFVGLKDEYDDFMTRNGYKHPGHLSSQCSMVVPEYMVAGGVCGKEADESQKLRDCELQHYRIMGGTCIQDKSTLYLHCVRDSSSREQLKHMGIEERDESLAQWGQWEVQGWCDDSSDFFKVKWRNCVPTEKGKRLAKKMVKLGKRFKPYCAGTPVEIEPACNCIPGADTSNDNYNAGYEIVDPYEDYDSYGYDSSSSYRRRRRATDVPDFC